MTSRGDHRGFNVQRVMQGWEGRGEFSGRCDARQERATIDMRLLAVFEGSTKIVDVELAAA